MAPGNRERHRRLGRQVVDSRLFDDIRGAAREVAARARHVLIDNVRLVPYAASLADKTIPMPAWDPRFHYLGAPDDTAAFVLTLDAVNFGSGYFPHLHKRPGLSGYFTLASSLKDRFDTAGPLSAEDLELLTAADCSALFGQDAPSGPVVELMHLFARALNDLGQYLRLRFAGSFTAAIEAAGGSAERLVGLLAEMPSFQDVARYDQLEVPLYKRAQLTAADLALAFEGRGLGRFEDLHRLTIFADNLVPHVLRVDGVLRYDPDLAARVDAGDPIPAGSHEETEIRAVALHAVEMLVAGLHDTGHDVTAMRLDHLLWNRGQEAAYKARPRHRTRTVFY
jgi:hypothetical protein